jgi:hypothetical protein
MALMGALEGIGRGFKRAGRWVGDEFNRVVAPIHSAATGDWRGAASGLGRNIKRAGQAGALFGKDKLAGVDVDILGAGGGAIEGGLGPSRVARDEMGDTGEGGFAGAARGALGGFGGVKGAQAVHNIGERLGINQRISGLRGDGLGPQAPIEARQNALAANIGSGVADGARVPAGDQYWATHADAMPTGGSSTGVSPQFANVPAGDRYWATHADAMPTRAGAPLVQPAATTGRTEISRDRTRNPRNPRTNNIGKTINGNGNDKDPRSLWRKGLDYAGDNPDVVISALGDMFSGDSGMNEYYRRMAGVQERAQALREKQDAYESDRERLRDQFLLRGPTSKWV